MIIKAPGKLVLWGEYAVLAGAPAAVAAVNRWVQVDIELTDLVWQFVSVGLDSPATHSYSNAFMQHSGAAMTNCIFAHLGFREYPFSFAQTTDSSAFFEHEQKLGLGSSAAVCVATYQGICKFLDRSADVQEAIQIHRHFQGGSGSGMDIAASWHGGAIKFQDGECEPFTWPSELSWLPVWTGNSASTPKHLNQFSDWRKTADTSALTQLCDVSEALFTQTSMDNFEAYAFALKKFDDVSQVGVFTDAHNQLTDLAAKHGFVYKPCGAGGGDFGMAICPAVEKQACAQYLRESGFEVPHLEFAEHGVSVE